MDIFKLKPTDTQYFSITEEIYFDKTGRNYPYKNKNNAGGPLYHAVCPECGNPTEIRCIAETKDASKKPYGKHYPRHVPDLAMHDDGVYQNCSLRGDVSIGSKGHRTNEDFSHEILRLLVDHALVIRDLFAKCIGVTVSEHLFKVMVKEFVTRNSFRCKGVRPSNLPFAIAYWAENQSLMLQPVSDAALRKAIADSKDFDISDSGKAVRAAGTEDDVAVKFYFSGHHQGKEKDNESNTINLYVAKYKGIDRKTTLYSKKVSYTNGEFFAAILKEMRSTTDAAIAKRAKWSEMARTIVMAHCPEALSGTSAISL